MLRPNTEQHSCYEGTWSTVDTYTNMLLENQGILQSGFMVTLDMQWPVRWRQKDMRAHVGLRRHTDCVSVFETFGTFPWEKSDEKKVLHISIIRRRCSVAVQHIVPGDFQVGCTAANQSCLAGQRRNKNLGSITCR